jgi:glycogen operon protein
MGAEGPTDDPEIARARERQMRNFLTTLLFSQGVPMISGGDEMGRTQNGNNNAYCQDNELSWYHWDGDPAAESLIEFTARLIESRKNHPNLRRRKFFQDRSIHNCQDIAWYGTDGNELSQEAWNAGWMRSLGMLLNGETLQVTDELGQPVIDDSFLVLLNAHHEAVSFVIPAAPGGGKWKCVLNTNELETPFKTCPVRKKIKLEGRSIQVLMEKRATPEAPGI